MDKKTPQDNNQQAFNLEWEPFNDFTKKKSTAEEKPKPEIKVQVKQSEEPAAEKPTIKKSLHNIKDKIKSAVSGDPLQELKPTDKKEVEKIVEPVSMKRLTFEVPVSKFQQFKTKCIENDTTIRKVLEKSVDNYLSM